MARLKLYSEKTGDVQRQAGLNWGFSDGHVCRDDAYVAITARFIESNPGFFPTRSCEIEVIWDDGEHMWCSVEGTQEIQGVTHPKQLTSANDKSVFGVYMRERLGVPLGERVTMEDLDNYGRRDIEIIKRGAYKYEIDFSVD